MSEEIENFDAELRLLMKIGLVKYDPKTKKYYATEKAMNLSREETAKLIMEAYEEDEKRVNQYIT